MRERGEHPPAQQRRVAGRERRGGVAHREQHHEQLQCPFGLPPVDHRRQSQRADDNGQRVAGDEVAGGRHGDTHVARHRGEQSGDDELRAAALSASATTRLVNRLEDRGFLVRVLCADDRRGIYTELTETGRAAYEQARPTHDRILEQALSDAEQIPELAALVGFLHRVPAPR